MIFIFILTIVLNTNCIICLPSALNNLETPPKLLVISYDGFRNEFFDRNVTHYMNSLRKNGSYADYMINVFPTKTFPNHHTISTGVNVDYHGVSSTIVFDKEKGKLAYGYDLFHYNSSLIPIWILNQRAGRNRFSGCMMWPGTNFSYLNDTCHFIEIFNQSISFEARLDTVMTWFTHPKTPANLVFCYIEEPDFHAHAFGPESSTITNIVKKLDNLTEYIQNKLKKYNLIDSVNVIHLSDHGFDSVPYKNFINLTDFVSNSTYTSYGGSPVLQIVPNHGYENIVYDQLKHGSLLTRNFDVFLNEELPEKWRFKNKNRTGPITLVAKLGYGFGDLFKVAQFYEQFFNVTFPRDHKFGLHGYDNEFYSMHPFFFANGPQIKARTKIESIHTLDLFNLFCRILKIKQMHQDSNLNRNINILKMDEFERQPNLSITIVFIAAILCLIILSLCITYVIHVRKFRQNALVVNRTDIYEYENLLDSLNNEPEEE